MRKISVILLMAVLVALISSMLATTAFATDYESAAQELKTIGLFQGTDLGFDLDRVPTRTEAAVMLVRLLGAESGAKSQYAEGKIRHPFTDVPQWANPYIAWLYSNGLTKGLSETSYGATGQCTAKMYCTFVMRALGYSDSKGDFSFDTADTFAENLGIFDSSLVEDAFLRDHAVAISYQAIAAYIKGTNTTLLEKLIKDGAVKESTAATLLGKVKTYNAYLAAYGKMNALTSMDMSIKQSLKMVGEQTKMSYSTDTGIAAKIVVNQNNQQMEIHITTDNEGNIVAFDIWVKDGYIYVKTGSIRVKTVFDASALNELMAGASTGVPAIALYDFSSVTAASVIGGTEYTFTYGNDSKLIEELDLGLDSSELSDVSVSKFEKKVLVGGDGLVKSFAMNVDFSFMGDVDDGQEKVSCTYSLTGAVNATGNSVYISFPDFSGYIEQ